MKARSDNRGYPDYGTPDHYRLHKTNQAAAAAGAREPYPNITKPHPAIVAHGRFRGGVTKTAIPGQALSEAEQEEEGRLAGDPAAAAVVADPGATRPIRRAAANCRLFPRPGEKWHFFLACLG